MQKKRRVFYQSSGFLTRPQKFEKKSPNCFDATEGEVGDFFQILLSSQCLNLTFDIHIGTYEIGRYSYGTFNKICESSLLL